MPINWCPSCKTGLSNEEVIGGCCERCGGEVIHKVKNQWMLKITEYADRLIDDLEEVDYPQRVKAAQINWIGRSYGAEINFETSDGGKINVFTTRPDTIFGVTYLAIACEHKLIEKNKDKIKNYDEVKKYIEATLKKSDFERSEVNKDKTGVVLDGIYAIHPFTKEKLPIFVSDYILMSYGTGAIMAVPCHDDRDFAFAKKFNMGIKQVISGDFKDQAITDTEGKTLINSSFLDGLSVDEAKEKAIEEIEKIGVGKKTKNFKLRDWVFSRQRYWGEPIPLIYCEEHGYVPVKEEDLPLVLPDVENYEPTDDGESPLSKIDSFVNTTCPICGKPAKRETDTMPQWAGSSWYYLRYMDPHNDKEPVSKKAVDYYGPVDWYNGGMEHTTLHLLYSRFWHKFLYDLNLVSTKEPYLKRTSHGMILGENGEKMSKSRGNVVNPDEVVEKYGADTLRCYEMFIGDFEKSVPWSDSSMNGCRKFLEKVFNLRDIITDGENYSEDLEILINKTIKKVSDDYENLKYNTAIAALMELLNEFRKKDKITKKDFSTYLTLLYPVAPHVTSELFKEVFDSYVYDEDWPSYDENKLTENTVTIPVQILGKTKDTIDVDREINEEDLVELIKSKDEFKKYLEGKNIVKVIYIKEKIINLIVK